MVDEIHIFLHYISFCQEPIGLFFKAHRRRKREKRRFRIFRAEFNTLTAQRSAVWVLNENYPLGCGQ